MLTFLRSTARIIFRSFRQVGMEKISTPLEDYDAHNDPLKLQIDQSLRISPK